MWQDLPDHPDIAETMRTGYPSHMQGELVCDRCGDELLADEVYEDDEYECLCMGCLCSLHKKTVWEDADW